MNLSSYRPQRWAELIGPANTIGRAISAKLARLDHRTDTCAIMFDGTPGCGKTSIARLAARQLAGEGNHFAIEEISGPAIDSELVKKWHDTRGLGCLFGNWRIKIWEEADRIPSQSQVLALNYLDNLQPGTAVFATSNKKAGEMSERFHSRFQFVTVHAPSTEEITRFLTQMCPALPVHARNMIAVGCGGNVRGALLDAENTMDMQLIAA